MSRVKAAYNAAKSLIISRFLPKNARVVHFGSGADVLKYDPHEPVDVILLGNSEDSLVEFVEFAKEKNVQYALGMRVADIFNDFFAEQTTTVYHYTMVVPRRVRLDGVNFITTFSVLEQCSDITKMEHLCQQIARMLLPGGTWVGCVTNASRLLERCDGTGQYQDNYCAIAINDCTDTYRFQTAQRDCQQHLWTLPTIIRMAEKHGLKLCLQESLLDVLGNARNDEHYASIRQLNHKLRLRLDDLQPLSLLHFFCFFKPGPEQFQ